MSACKEPSQHRHLWVVLARHGAWHHYLNERWVEQPVWKHSGKSEVYCPECPTRWRTGAAYVDQLPDAERGTPVTRQARTPLEQRIYDLVEDDPLLAELTYLGNGGVADQKDFLHSVSEQLTRYGRLSEKQREHALRLLRRLQRRQADLDADAAYRRSLGPSAAPRERLRVVGLVEDVFLEEQGPFENDDTPPRLRMRILADAGYQVECSVPASLRRTHGDHFKGRKIALTITVKPKWNAPYEAWGSYPSQDARLIDGEAR